MTYDLADRFELLLITLLARKQLTIDEFKALAEPRSVALWDVHHILAVAQTGPLGEPGPAAAANAADASAVETVRKETPKDSWTCPEPGCGKVVLRKEGKKAVDGRTIQNHRRSHGLGPLPVDEEEKRRRKKVSNDDELSELCELDEREEEKRRRKKVSNDRQRDRTAGAGSEKNKFDPDTPDSPFRTLPNGDLWCDACGVELRRGYIQGHVDGSLHEAALGKWVDGGRSREGP